VVLKFNLLVDIYFAGKNNKFNVLYYYDLVSVVYEHTNNK